MEQETFVTFDKLKNDFWPKIKNTFFSKKQTINSNCIRFNLNNAIPLCIMYGEVSGLTTNGFPFDIKLVLSTKGVVNCLSGALVAAPSQISLYSIVYNYNFIEILFNQLVSYVQGYVSIEKNNIDAIETPNNLINTIISQESMSVSSSNFLLFNYRTDDDLQSAQDELTSDNGIYAGCIFYLFNETVSDPSYVPSQDPLYTPVLKLRKHVGDTFEEVTYNPNALNEGATNEYIYQIDTIEDSYHATIADVATLADNATVAEMARTLQFDRTIRLTGDINGQAIMPGGVNDDVIINTTIDASILATLNNSLILNDTNDIIQTDVNSLYVDLTGVVVGTLLDGVIYPTIIQNNNTLISNNYPVYKSTIASTVDNGILDAIVKGPIWPSEEYGNPPISGVLVGFIPSANDHTTQIGVLDNDGNVIIKDPIWSKFADLLGDPIYVKLDGAINSDVVALNSFTTNSEENPIIINTASSFVRLAASAMVTKDRYSIESTEQNGVTKHILHIHCGYSTSNNYFHITLYDTHIDEVCLHLSRTKGNLNKVYETKLILDIPNSQATIMTIKDIDESITLISPGCRSWLPLDLLRPNCIKITKMVRDVDDKILYLVEGQLPN